MEAEFTITTASLILFNNQPVAIIKAMGLCMPISMGSWEAEAIRSALLGLTTSRPMTHALVKEILIRLGVALRKVVITEFREEGDAAFYVADLCLEKDGSKIFCDCRPSDAIVLALRFGVPMFIEEDVLLKSLDVEPIKQFLALLEEHLPEAMQTESEST